MRKITNEDRLFKIFFCHSPVQEHVIETIIQKQSKTPENLIIGHRGMSGDLTYEKFVLNDLEFAKEFMKMITDIGLCEVYLPHLNNLIGQLCEVSSNVVNVNILDEGNLTYRSLVEGMPTKDCRTLAFARLLLKCGIQMGHNRLQKALISRSIGIIRRNQQALRRKEFSIIGSSKKSGRIYSQFLVRKDTKISNFKYEYCDLRGPATKELLAQDFQNSVVVFLHVNDIENLEISSINKKLKVCQNILVCLHPSFRAQGIEFGGRLRTNFHEKALVHVFSRKTKLDVIFELYMRGIRRAYVSTSSITRTVSEYNDFFQDLRVEPLFEKPERNLAALVDEADVNERSR